MTKQIKRKPVHITESVLTDVKKLAEKRKLSVGETVDHVLGVGLTRIKALKKYSDGRKAA